MGKLIVALSVILGVAGCRHHPSFSELSQEFTYTTLSFSPSSATGAGLHQYQKQNLDDLLDDFNPAALDKQRRFYQGFSARLNQLQTASLSAEDRADLTVIRDQISLALLELNEIQTPQHNPTIYVETLGNALFTPFTLEYASPAERIRHIIARLQKVPLFLDQAGTNLVLPPSIWARVAMEENQGNMNLVDQTIRAWVPADGRDAYARAASPALAAMRKFQNELKNWSGGSEAGWRLGRERYARKFRYALDAGIEADTALQVASQELERVRAHMLELALPLHRQFFAAHKDHAGLSDTERQNQVIGGVLAKIAERHSTPESYMDDARKDLEEARAFVREKHLLTLPARSNLQVIPTPEFMRGAYSVGGFNPAPALEPQLGAFYWITPIPPDWPKDRAESKLREYNFYKLKLLTLHEAMPGHYVQMEVANDIQPPERRLLRSVYGSGPYIEGWGEFSTQMMLDEGFLDHSPEMALTFGKEELRVIGNLVLDVRLQTLNMTDQEALDFMQKETFQEKEEAVEKLQRAKLSSCQLPMYFLGWRGWLRVRDQYKQARGASYSPADFNDRALREGAVPLAVLGELLR